MKHTIELPDELDEKLREYLRENPGETVEGVVRGMLESKFQPFTPTNEDWDAFMSLAGMVEEAEVRDPERPEDDVVWQARDSRDA